MSSPPQYENGAYGAHVANNATGAHDVYGSYPEQGAPQAHPNVYRPQAPQSPAYDQFVDPAAAHGWQNAYDETQQLPQITQAPQAPQLPHPPQDAPRGRHRAGDPADSASPPDALPDGHGRAHQEQHGHPGHPGHEVHPGYEGHPAHDGHPAPPGHPGHDGVADHDGHAGHLGHEGAPGPGGHPDPDSHGGGGPEGDPEDALRNYPAGRWYDDDSVFTDNSGGRERLLRRVAIGVGAAGVLFIGAVVAGAFDSGSSGGRLPWVQEEQGGGVPGAQSGAPVSPSDGASASTGDALPSAGASSSAGASTGPSVSPSATQSAPAAGGATAAQPSAAPSTTAPATTTDPARGNAGDKPGRGQGASKGPK
ncbi:hypothetical protein JS756_14650 [Streptomyces actuosus]|uniref:Serine protease n=1 Tax=Streptomyces actuosus TaxID=1885 RepID=A0ABS2VQD2_STRAS|nr:hypothetical protein [Streptomyces actuosus]MBN0045327.1 hypothetical protein [Streptomyces actuosus]